jgi:hypothetical protein
MSWFGDGTFKQDVLDHVESEINMHNLSRADAIAQLLKVVQHIAETAFSREEALAKAFDDDKKAAYREIRAKISETP